MSLICQLRISWGPHNSSIGVAALGSSTTDMTLL